MPPNLLPKPPRRAGPSDDNGGPSGAIPNMPPRPLPMPPRGAEPSGDNGGPSGAMDPDLRNVRNVLDPLHMPTIRGETLTVQQFQVLWAAWHWYLVGERHLLPTEVQEIASIYCDIPQSKSKPVPLFNKLDNPKYHDNEMDPIESLTEPERQRLIDKVTKLFELLIKEPEAKARSEELKGFQGRLSQLPFSTANSRALDGHVLRTAQFYLIYSVGNWLKDSEDNDITDSDAREVVNKYYEYKISRGRFSTLLKDLRDPTHTLNASMRIIMMEPRHREFFGNKALELYRDYTRRKGLPDPHLDIPTDGDVEGESEPTTTTTMEMLSLTTTAPSSSVPTALGPSQGAELDIPESNPDSEFFNAAYYGGRSIEASPSPSGSGSNEPSGKDKGRARESSSSSPGDKGSAKGKEKRPRRGGK